MDEIGQDRHALIADWRNERDRADKAEAEIERLGGLRADERSRGESMRVRAETAEAALAAKDAQIARLRKALAECARVEQRDARNDVPFTIHDGDGISDLASNERSRRAWNAAHDALALKADNAALHVLLHQFGVSLLSKPADGIKAHIARVLAGGATK